MSHPAQVRTTPIARHRLTPPGRTPRWIGFIAASLTVASVAAVAPPLAPKDIRVVNATEVALTAQSTGSTELARPYPIAARTSVAVADAPVSSLFDPQINPVLTRISDAIYLQLLAAFQDPQQREVIGDFFQGGIAGVLKKQATSRLKSPDQTQILNDFFEGGVFQSEAHRFLQLFTDPQQHEFISDFVTGGLVQVVRNRLLDATSSPEQRAAIIAFFPDEVTDYRGGPIAVVQRRLIAAAKGNPIVIGLVNGIFENPVVVAVQHLIGGGPLIGTPLSELPPITPDAAVAPPHTASVEDPASVTPDPTVVQRLSAVPTASARTTAPEPANAPAKPAASLVLPAASVEPSTSSTSAPKAKATPDAEPETTPDADVIKTGNKVEPAGIEGAAHPKPNDGSPGTPGQAAEAEPAASAATASGAEGTGGET